MVHKARGDYLRRKYRESLLHLQMTPNDGDKTAAELRRLTEYYNNAGCVSLQLGHIDAALLFFRRGLHLLESTAHTRRCGIHCEISFVKGTALVYNCGIALLKLNQPLSAFNCLERVSRYLKMSPTYWLRLAECCIYHDVNVRAKDDSKQKSPVHTFLSSGRTRRLVVR